MCVGFQSGFDCAFLSVYQAKSYILHFETIFSEFAKVIKKIIKVSGRKHYEADPIAIND